MTLADLAAQARESHEAATTATRSALDHAIRCGEALTRAKELVLHGQWFVWLADNFPASERKARSYMQLAKSRATIEAKRQSSADLSIDAALRALRRETEPTPGPEPVDPPSPGQEPEPTPEPENIPLLPDSSRMRRLHERDGLDQQIAALLDEGLTTREIEERHSIPRWRVTAARGRKGRLLRGPKPTASFNWAEHLETIADSLESTMSGDDAPWTRDPREDVARLSRALKQAMAVMRKLYSKVSDHQEEMKQDA